jgi:hypothetical protein
MPTVKRSSHASPARVRIEEEYTACGAMRHLRAELIRWKTMQLMKCPNCNAPANPAPGQAAYRCGYCGATFDTGYRPPEPPPPQQGPTIIVLGPGHTHEEPDFVMPVRAVTSGIGTIIRLFVILIIVAAAGGFTMISRCSTLASSMVWDGSAPFSCAGNDDIAVKGVHAQFNAGTAVTVSGNCHFTCTDCTIKAPVAFDVAGNGSVTVVNGNVAGTTMLVDATGNAHVNISGNVVSSGAVHQSGNARVNAPTPPPESKPPPPTPAAPPTVPPQPAKPVKPPHR